MKNYSVSHPWELIRCKALYFPILNVIYRLPLPYKTKVKIKRRLFYDKFAEFSRKHFRGSSTSRLKQNVEIYDLGPFKICILSDLSSFDLNTLEWNLSYEFFDILYPALNQRYFRFILGEGPYESERIFIEKGDFVVDAGANLGVFTCLSSLKVGQEGHVFAVEPLKFFMDCIQESIAVNAMGNITPLGVALGRSNKEIEISLDFENPMGTGIIPKTSQMVKVNQTSLDVLVFEEKRIPRVDFLKMDIEGSERKALAGAEETIFKFKPKLSICTYHLKDDPVVLPGIIRKIDPNYKIEMGKKKLYARI